MPEKEADTPLDLSSFDDFGPVTPGPGSAGTDPRLALEPQQPRLVDVANLGPDELAVAERGAARVNFRETTSLLSHGDGVLADVSSSPAFAWAMQARSATSPRP